MCQNQRKRCDIDMQLIIDKAEYQENVLSVTGKTAIGTIRGIWKYMEKPSAGQIYSVALSIDYLHETSSASKNYSSVHVEGENVIFTGLCEDFDDKYYYLRFDKDWVDMIYVRAIISERKKGDYISFSANWRNIRIYPYDL